jgi:hypothetical protein
LAWRLRRNFLGKRARTALCDVQVPIGGDCSRDGDVECQYNRCLNDVCVQCLPDLPSEDVCSVFSEWCDNSGMCQQPVRELMGRVLS